MRNKLAVAMLLVLFLCVANADAQNGELPKVELAVEFSALGRDDFSGSKSNAGVGGRFTFNLNESVALEAAGYFFPQRCLNCEKNGRVTEGLFGVKAGKRFKNWGIFAKARPGFMSFGDGNFEFVAAPMTPAFPFATRVSRSTHFAVDLGGVVEFYPSRKIVTRFDFGDTIVHYQSRTANFLGFDPATGQSFLAPFRIPSRTRHNFQFIAGVGFRF